MCAKCGYELFSSRSKYAHSSPWPAFTETIHADSVAKRPEHNRPGAIKVGGSRRQWQPTPVLLLGKSHGQRSLVACSPWGRYESGMTERLHFLFTFMH